MPGPHPLPAYGKLHALDYASWARYVREYVAPFLRSAGDIRLLDAGLRSAIECALDRAMEAWKDPQPSLIHCDFHYENVLHENGRLSGLLDFEWALTGDPVYDLSIAHVRERMVPESEAVLIAGYQSVRPLDPGHERRVRCYQMIQQLEQAVARQRLGDRTNAAILVASLRQLVEPLDPACQ